MTNHISTRVIESLESLTEKIRPLPESVVPSERFQQQMKLRLLNLPQAKGGIVNKAA